MSYTIFKYIRLLAEFKRVRSTKINYTSKILKNECNIIQFIIRLTKSTFQSKTIIISASFNNRSLYIYISLHVVEIQLDAASSFTSAMLIFKYYIKSYNI